MTGAATDWQAYALVALIGYLIGSIPFGLLLTRAAGLGGRLRAVGGDAERARTAVARALRYAIDRLDEQAPTLAAHLANCLHTGTYCCYRPDPLAPVAWSL